MAAAPLRLDVDALLAFAAEPVVLVTAFAFLAFGVLYASTTVGSTPARAPGSGGDRAGTPRKAGAPAVAPATDGVRKSARKRAGVERFAPA